MRNKPLSHLAIIHDCSECTLRREGFFCGVSPETLELFAERKITNAYSAGSMLFVEGQPAGGVYMLCQGAVKLYTSSSDGKVLILHIALPGELLGLSAVVTGENHEMTAEVIEPCQVNYVSRPDFLRLLNSCPDLSMNAVKQLCIRDHDTCNQIRSLMLSSSAAGKLANLMLDWCEITNRGNGPGRSDETRPGEPRPVSIEMRFTHEEVAEMIGTSRETITRLLRIFKERKLISLNGSELLVHDTRGLMQMVTQTRHAGAQTKM